MATETGNVRMSAEALKARMSLSDEAENCRRFESFSLHNHRNELWEGDTLVFIDFPPEKGSAPADCFGTAWAPILIRISSEKIHAIGSAKFESLLKVFGGRTMQKAKKRGLAEEDLKGVKYSMDLTPDDEGDDFVFQMTQLSLTPGITHWWTAVEKHGVQDAFAGGHDDVCNCWNDPSKDIPEAKTGDLEYTISRATSEDGVPGGSTVYTLDHPGRSLALQVMKQNGKTETQAYPDFRRIPDYCPIRHRLNILRVLYIIESKPVTIDSAPRLWTLVGLAQIFDCVHIIAPWVRGWLSARANSHIIEILPEEMLQLAMTLQLADVAKCAFRILVNELALERAGNYSPVDCRHPLKFTIFGRKKKDLSDDLQNIVEHAAGALGHRTASLLDTFLSNDVFVQMQIEEWTWVMNVKAMLEAFKGKSHSQQALDQLNDMEKKLLKVWKTEIVQWSLQAKPDNTQISTDDDRALYVEPVVFMAIDCIYPILCDKEKVLLPLYYLTLTKRWEDGPFLTTRPQRIDTSKPVLNFNEAMNIWIEAHANELVGTQWESLFSKQQSFRINEFDAQITNYLTPVVLNQWTHTNISIPLPLSRHLLLNLTDNELKFLPLWAGGCDDGTGGVFEDMVPPPATLGPVGPGPIYHTGYSVASDASSAASISADLRELDIQSTIGGASLDVQDSNASTTLHHGKVVAGSVSARSEAFTDTSDAGNAYNDARHEVPADGQTGVIRIMMEVPIEESGLSSGENQMNGSDYEFEADSDDTLSAYSDIGDGNTAQAGNALQAVNATQVSDDVDMIDIVDNETESANASFQANLASRPKTNTGTLDEMTYTL
ncbi:hypothetical protein F5X68DRAFT_259064 [Plectosphaerella plurivora]|uniref:Uncharacterized protein n=1 Tax=Plectosphaerella plurivora TaxID=936078 RepID=A0A9P9AFU8_9PEZI|nr:hypothetical protein F5X68DRAFT_259064 [Plectosphaerella plurivora]